MKNLLIIIFFAMATLHAAEKVPSMALAHIEAITKSEGAKLIKPVAVWPERFTMLKKKLGTKVKNKKDHQRLLDTIPKKFFKGYVIGSTIETKDWILTSIDPANSEAKESLWIMVIATKKGGDYVFAHSQW